MAHENYITFNFSVEKERFVGTYHGHLRPDYGGFCPIVAELSSCQRDHMTHEAKNIYYLTL